MRDAQALIKDATRLLRSMPLRTSTDRTMHRTFTALADALAEAEKERCMVERHAIQRTHETLRQVEEAVARAERAEVALLEAHAEIRDGWTWLSEFVQATGDPGTGALAWLARNHPKRRPTLSAEADA